MYFPYIFNCLLLHYILIICISYLYNPFHSYRWDSMQDEHQVMFSVRFKKICTIIAGNCGFEKWDHQPHPCTFITWVNILFGSLCVANNWYISTPLSAATYGYWFLMGPPGSLETFSDMNIWTEVLHKSHTGIILCMHRANERCGSDYKSVILEHMLQIKFMGTSCENALSWMPRNVFDDKSTLVQIMALCHQASSQCCPRSV